MIIHSENQRIRTSGNRVYDFLNDFTNFEQLLPDQVKNWKASPRECSFTIEGLSRVSLIMGDNEPMHRVIYVSSGDTPIHFSISFKLSHHSDEEVDAALYLETEMSPMIEMMARKPLQHFIDVMAAKLRTVMEMPRH